MTVSKSPRNIVLGVAGGIAAYKACHLVRNFKEHGDNVRVVPTVSALNFVGAATFEALSGNPVSTSVFEAVEDVQHVAVGQEADAVVIAPATADLIARLAAGRADDLLTATVLVATCPIIVAPAMHTEMWNNPATQDNVKTLRRRGITVMEPAHGRLTGKDTGAGRLPDPEQIAAIARTELAGFHIDHSWSGLKVVISAGGTQEELDPVRYIGNRSSGRQGFALAEVAAHKGADVTIVAGNIAELPLPSGATIRDIVSAQDLESAMREESRDADIVIMAAAVADYRPANVAESKMKKGKADDALAALEMVENPDILKSLVAAREEGEVPENCVIVGFAAETGDADSSALEYAQEKFARKGCDVLMANEVGRGVTFGQESSEGWILRRNVEPQRVEHGSKQVVAAQILGVVNEMIEPGN
ncbi:bifunctional phosphopantothenoylcysteine decarboxylase/phosphopantothenate--cysteine ligase CoaBC [Corynebacterium rhinophilum]|uniref:bifunctional phosphopantothenoylcysteine decarboxylase/phosphopantothenate--cysteine ligase CoaBC n=1 Tax=Corynebacterium rhinophilum TaxID=3050197 RepID=UPI00254DA4C9|nr:MULTISPECIES: bifunctional phosphopantothenoylcysteine decarboxylase/phosphopantothenate--cysteine ligase CoaBC [unclassified Corynebacterium]MDK8452182.1 bifunctional phosphopantothenoylcysteine decarboxylase/phosphopantothenate--cysteine ligase CoaBC [Corynebacterium sp. MSK084]MDK8514119.1 bifunctional phosphopantothenoylcysteine decarboxylase/phosphopantothenate--cysteine ligase CoaBC [Corynebacterium sp. MSK123]MDK8547133.1 bifunctional phosphopantothenoylcysteine decarboxylase/phosphopa